MVKRGRRIVDVAGSALHCAIATLNVPPIQRVGNLDVEEPQNPHSRDRTLKVALLHGAYYLQRLEIDHFLETFDQYRKQKQIA
jgi:hypothetical protein